MRADIFESLYRRIFEKLQEKVDSGELTLEVAKSLNDEAYNKYVVDKGYHKLKSESVLTERVFISEDNFMNNIEKWGPGYPLFITGTSGDGKSTLSDKYAKSRPNTLLVHTDTFLLRLSYTKEKYEETMSKFMSKSGYRVAGDEMSIDYIRQNPDLPYSISNTDNQEYAEHFIKYIKWIMVNAKTNPKYKNKSIIVEGCDISYMDPMLMAQYPLIIIGCSRLVTSFHRIKRDLNNGHNIIKALFKEIAPWKRTYIPELNFNKDYFRTLMGVSKDI